MNVEKKLKILSIVLVLVGLFFVFGLYPTMHFFPDSWAWLPRQYEYEQMIVGVYATLGVFLILAARNPLKNRSLIWFTVWSSFVHAGIMFVQALVDPMEMANLHGDIPSLFLVAIVLAILMPREKELTT